MGPGPAHGPRELMLQGPSSAVLSLRPKDDNMFVKEKLLSDSGVVVQSEVTGIYEKQDHLQVKFSQKWDGLCNLIF